MIATVKKILLRRSGTRNMFRSRDNMSKPPAASSSGYRSLPVGEGVPSGRRAAVAPGSRDHLGAATGGLDGLDGAAREGVGANRDRPRELPTTEDLHEPALGDEPVRAQ